MIHSFQCIFRVLLLFSLVLSLFCSSISLGEETKYLNSTEINSIEKEQTSDGNLVVNRHVIMKTVTDSARLHKLVSEPSDKQNKSGFQNHKVKAAFKKNLLKLQDGGRMNYYLRRGIGPTLVLIPGTWGGIWRFETLIAALPENIEIAVIELQWQAGNKPPSLDISMKQIADDVLKAIKVMRLKRFVVSGHSIGGMTAVEIAGRNVPGLVGQFQWKGGHTTLWSKRPLMVSWFPT